MRVLLIEDDEMLGQSLVDGLRESAHAVDWVRRADEAEAAVIAHDYALCLLDLGLPDVFGLEWLASRRARGQTPATIVLTAYDSVDICVQGLDTGADDYIVKPFSLAELEARIRKTLRRTTDSSEPVLECGSIHLDPASHRVTFVGTESATSLSRREYALFYALMRRPGRILSREQLESQIYGWGEEVDSNAVEYLIRAVRQKLGTNVIRNVRGLGWWVNDPG